MRGMRVKTILCALFILGLFGGCITTTPQPPRPTERSDRAYTETPLGENTFRIDVHGTTSDHMEQLRNIAIVRAAQLASSSGYEYFRIHDSWSYHEVRYVMDFPVGKYHRTIVVKLTNDPDDIDAQKILDMLGPAE